MSKSRRRRLHRCGCETCYRHPYGSVAQQHRAINRVLVTLDEKNRRRVTGLLAIQEGDRSIAPLSRITGLSRTTIHRGKRELEHPASTRRGRIRAPGAGRPRTEKKRPVFSRPSMTSWPMRPRAIRSPDSSGRARPCANWPAACRGSSTWGVRPSPACCGASAMRCGRIANGSAAITIRNAIAKCATSPDSGASFSKPGGPSSVSIRRKRS